MINPTGYEARCDETACDRSERDWNIFTLYNRIKAAGWQRGVKLNGERAKRGGKDYCPEHRRGPS